MELIFEKQEKKKSFIEALSYDECVVEYVEQGGDFEKILIVKDSNLESIIVFFNSTLYTYSLSNGIQEVYEQIKDDFLIEAVIDVYPVSTVITCKKR